MTKYASGVSYKITRDNNNRIFASESSYAERRRRLRTSIGHRRSNFKINFADQQNNSAAAHRIDEPIAIIDDNDRWNWRVSLKASGPPRPVGQVSRCQLMSPLPETAGFSDVMWNGLQRVPRRSKRKNSPGSYGFVARFLVRLVYVNRGISDKECSIHDSRKR
nr:PREDICTED: uncharacterized protein LOC105678867 [Linepithema humile]